jgi:hypothetical protein
LQKTQITLNRGARYAVLYLMQPLFLDSTKRPLP